MLPSSSEIEFSAPIRLFRSSIARPTGTPIYASTSTSRSWLQDLGPRWIRSLLSCRTLTFPAICRFIPALFRYAHLIGIGRRSPADPCHTTGPYTAIRECYVGISSSHDGNPSDLKYAFESPTDRALAFARYQGPSPLPAVLLAGRGRTPSSNRAARRRRVFSTAAT